MRTNERTKRVRACLAFQSVAADTYEKYESVFLNVFHSGKYEASYTVVPFVPSCCDCLPHNVDRSVFPTIMAATWLLGSLIMTDNSVHFSSLGSYR